MEGWPGSRGGRRAPEWEESGQALPPLRLWSLGTRQRAPSLLSENLQSRQEVDQGGAGRLGKGKQRPGALGPWLGPRRSPGKDYLRSAHLPRADGS